MGIGTTDPEAHRHRCAISKRRSGFTSLASCPQYAISDGGGGAAAGRALLFWVLATVIIWESHDPTNLWV